MKKKLAFFDCDGTLIHTALPDVGKELWSQYYGKPYPHKGWWGREESLDLNVFSNHYNPEVYEHYVRMKNDPQYICFVLTSREPKLKHLLEQIFAKHDITMERIMCKKGNYSKGHRIQETIQEYMQHHEIDEVIMFEDRHKEIATIEPYRDQWLALGIELTCHKIESDAKD